MKMLVAEDEPAFRNLLQDVLVKWGYDVVAAGDGNEAWRILTAEDPPRIAIFDWMMPGMNGVEICRKVRRELPSPYTYIILLTSQKRDEDLITGMDAGADDYITKPFKHNELKVRLRAGRRIIELQNELITARERLREKASRDSLTGLLNHEEILSVLGHELARADREGSCVSVIMADLDFFKKVNDTHGHLAGDAVLRLTAQRMQSLMRSYDSIGRYGGEEFLIILPDCCRECAVAFAERLRSCIGSERMDTPEGLLAVTISLGVAMSCVEGACTPESLVKAADTALYRAKENGRNRVEMSEKMG